MPKEKTENGDDSGSRRDEECAEKDDASELKPVRPKIGEAEDNLKRREDWFQKRSGKK